jgi:hypothetical protein
LVRQKVLKFDPDNDNRLETRLKPKKEKEKMRLKKLSRTSLALLIIIGVLATAFATIYFSRTITNNATIKSSWGLSLWRMDAGYVNPVEMITSIAWGEIDPGTYVTTNQLFGTCLKLKNDGNTEIHVAWQLDPTTPLPSGVTLTAKYCYGDGWWDLPENDFSTITIAKGSFSGDSGNPNSGRIEFKLTIDSFADPTAFSFNILLKAADTSTG